MEIAARLRQTRIVIEELSSAEFQKRVWLDGSGPEVSSYEEAVCRLIDDLDFDRLVDVEWKQVGLTEQQAKALREFRDTLLEFGKDLPEIPDPKLVVRHPGLEEMRASALKAAQIFH